jgi:hypothetical protein
MRSSFDSSDRSALKKARRRPFFPLSPPVGGERQGEGLRGLAAVFANQQEGIVAPRRRLKAKLSPQFAVDLLAAKIPIETGCQGRAKRAACGGRDP